MLVSFFVCPGGAGFYNSEVQCNGSTPSTQFTGSKKHLNNKIFLERIATNTANKTNKTNHANSNKSNKSTNSIQSKKNRRYKMFTTTTSIVCNTTGCKSSPITITAENSRRQVWLKAGELGWERVNAGEQYCPACKELRHPKVVKTEKVAKTTKAETTKKADGKKAGKLVDRKLTTKSTVKPAAGKPVHVSPKNNGADKSAATAAFGQSTGKLAKSAKK